MSESGEGKAPRLTVTYKPTGTGSIENKNGAYIVVALCSIMAIVIIGGFLAWRLKKRKGNGNGKRQPRGTSKKGGETR